MGGAAAAPFFPALGSTGASWVSSAYIFELEGAPRQGEELERVVLPLAHERPETAGVFELSFLLHDHQLLEAEVRLVHDFVSGQLDVVLVEDPVVVEETEEVEVVEGFLEEGVAVVEVDFGEHHGPAVELPQDRAEALLLAAVELLELLRVARVRHAGPQLLQVLLLEHLGARQGLSPLFLDLAALVREHLLQPPVDGAEEDAV